MGLDDEDFAERLVEFRANIMDKLVKAYHIYSKSYSLKVIFSFRLQITSSIYIVAISFGTNKDV